MKLINYLLIILFFTLLSIYQTIKCFNQWKNNFKKIALQNNISEETFDLLWLI